MSARIQSDFVFDALRTEILACRMAPASKIKIPVICARFEVSLGAAREALSRLVAEGLVRNEPQKGFAVAPVSARELHDLTQARIALEALCLTSALARGDVEWETAIVGAFHRLSRIEPRTPARPDELNPLWSQAHEIFHSALVAACDNLVLLRLRAALYAESERYRHWCLPLLRGPLKRDVEGEHKALMEAVLARDTARGLDLMGAHLQRTEDMLAMSPVIQDGTLIADNAGRPAKSPATQKTGKRSKRHDV